MVTSIRMDDKLLCEVGICQQGMLADDSFHSVKGFPLCLSPYELFVARRQFSKRSKNMGSMDPHVAVIVDESNERAKLLACCWLFDSKNSFYLLR